MVALHWHCKEQLLNFVWCDDIVIMFNVTSITVDRMVTCRLSDGIS